MLCQRIGNTNVGIKPLISFPILMLYHRSVCCLSTDYVIEKSRWNALKIIP